MMTIKSYPEDRPDIKPTIIIGPKLREQLRRELRIRIDEWNFSNAPRRREITREISLIYELLGVEGNTWLAFSLSPMTGLYVASKRGKTQDMVGYMNEEFSLVESGESPEPRYDVSTNKMFDPSLDDGKGAKRDPDVYESVRAATRQQQADRDPMAKYTQRLEKVGKTVPGLLAEVEEIDNLAARDPIAGYKKLMNKYGHDPRAGAQHLWNGSSPNGDAQAAEQEIANHTIAEFDSRHSDPMSKHLRRMKNPRARR